MKFLSHALGGLILGLARLLTAVQGRWIGCAPVSTQRIYFANHASHFDFVLIWAVLPSALRALTRPVAAADYWTAGRLRRFIIDEVFRGVLIDRRRETRIEDPIETMLGALEAGDSLILFPEGTRNTGEETLLPFKGGLHALAERRPDIDLVPVWIDNVNRVLPKGEVIPVPLLCSVNFGKALHLETGETREAFLTRARQELLGLSLLREAR